MHTHQDTPIVVEKEFSAAYRWQHWIRALSIVVLTVTGFYIAVPFVDPGFNPVPEGFLQAYMRFAHLVAGFLVIAFFIFKFYLFLFAKNCRHEMASYQDFLQPSVWIKQIGYYLFISKHPHLRGAYNPLQFAAYMGFYVMLGLLILTGLILYVNVFHEGLGAWIYEPMRYCEMVFGGLANVRFVHHVLTWGVLVFVSLHVYLAVFNAVFVKEGCIDAIISGLKWKKGH